jgi:ectoine hydroxylase-related dioxygenase (phytanoyl-CoA dioxygenase family)
LEYFQKEWLARCGMTDMDTLQAQIDEPYELSRDQIASYQERGFVLLPGIFAPALLQHFRAVISAGVDEFNEEKTPLEQRTTYGKAFLQVMNLWARSEAVKRFVFGKRLARIAAGLMRCRGVRIYHDQALYKEPGGGFTPWHADQYYWPVSNANMCTAWVPLQNTPLEMGPLAFSEGSQRFQLGRDLAISDESETTLQELLRPYPTREAPFQLGDVSFHSGWTFHRAGANTTAQPREVMTVIYMDQDMRLVQPVNQNQVLDVVRWCPGVQLGEVIASPLNPILFSLDD